MKSNKFNYRIKSKVRLSWVLAVILMAVILSGCSLKGFDMGKSEKKTVEIIGHRGASFEAPENTLSSALLAWEMGADGVEVDVYLSKDNQIMVMHDETTKRTAGVDYKIAETSSEELRKLDVGLWKGEKYAKEPIPFLEEIVATVPAGKKLVVEIKCGKEIMPRLQQIIEHTDKKGQISFICFDLDVIAEAKALMPEIPCYWLRGTVKDKETKELLPHDPAWIKLVKEKNLDGLDVHYGGMTMEFTREVKKSGLALWIWTVDEPDDASRMIALGVDSITTNKPDVLLKLAQKQ